MTAITPIIHRAAEDRNIAITPSTFGRLFCHRDTADTEQKERRGFPDNLFSSLPLCLCVSVAILWSDLDGLRHDCRVVFKPEFSQNSMRRADDLMMRQIAWARRSNAQLIADLR